MKKLILLLAASFLFMGVPLFAQSSVVDNAGVFSGDENFPVPDAQGESYNFIQENALAFYIGAWVLSLIIALLTVWGMKGKMVNVHSKTEADNFIIPGSLVFTKRDDNFLYSTVTKTRKESSSSGSRAVSSGRSRGGGRKF